MGWPQLPRSVPSLLLVLVLLSGVAHADFSKTIQATPGMPVQAVATWYFANCTQVLGVGSYAINVAPKYGTLSFSTVSGIITGCPQGSPSLPAAAAFYTLSPSAAAGVSDYFQLYFELNGSVAEVIDVTVNPEVLTIAPTSLSNTTSGDPYSVQFSTSGAQGAVTWSGGSGLPAGFTFSAQGLLSSTGTPAAAPGQYNFTVQAQDSAHDTATQPLVLTVLTPDCSQKVNANITKIAVTANPTLSWNVISGSLYLTTNNEILGLDGVPIPGLGFFPFAPHGIDIDGGSAVSLKPGVSVYETPHLTYINNMTGWSGSATYGRGANALEEKNDALSPVVGSDGQTTPVALPLLDALTSPWVPSNAPLYPFIDSPNANLPLIDDRHQPLTSLSFTKSFTNYLACYFDSDNIPHTVATVNWSAHFDGSVYVPELFGVFFPRSARFFQDPGNAVTYNIQQGADLPQPVIDGPLANCHQTYMNFPDITPDIPPARCTP